VDGDGEIKIYSTVFYKIMIGSNPIGSNPGKYRE